MKNNARNIMKKIGLYALCATMTVTMCSCSKNGKKAETNSVPTIVWYMQKPVSDMSHQSMVEAEANKIIEKEIGAKISFQFIDSGSWANKTNVLLSSGEYFDLISDQGTRFVNNVEKNAYLDITDYIDTYAPVIKEKSDDFVWGAVSFNNKIYAIPSQTFYVPYSSFAFKKDLVEKYKFDYENIENYSDLEPFLKQIKNNEPGMYPLCVTARSPLPALQSHDYLQTSLVAISFDKNNDKFIASIDSPDDLARYKVTNDFYKKGYIPNDAASKTETISEIKSGKYATFMGRRNATKTSNLYGFECVESKPLYGVIGRSNITNAVTAVGRVSKNPEKALQLLNLIWADKNLSNLLAYGIENVDYKVVSGKGTDDISVEPKSGNDVKWSIWHNWLGPLWDQWDSPWNSRESLMEMKNLNETSEVSPIVGFVPDVSEFKTQIAMISSVDAECSSVLNTGTMTDFDEYVKAVRKRYEEAGINKVLDSVNNQYKQWKKAQ